MYEFTSFSGPFAGCPGDVHEFVVELDRLFDGLVIPGGPSRLYHWMKSYDPGAKGSEKPDQYLIARTSNAVVSPVFILFGNLIGSAVPPPPEGWSELRGWLNQNGWGDRLALLGEADFQDRDRVPAGKIPLSGTMFELFDVLSSNDETELRVFDLSLIAGLPENVPDDVLDQQQKWLRDFLQEYARKKFLVRPTSVEEFRNVALLELKRAFGIGFLDPLKDPLPGLDAVKNGALLFGREDEVSTLTRRIFDVGDARHTVVLGRSGVGKSSLLGAGLIRDWYGRGLLRGTYNRATTVVVEPELLAPEDRSSADPLRTLGNILCGAGHDRTSRSVVERALRGPAPEIADATGDVEQDLGSALDWWAALASQAEGPMILILDQAEQIDAMTRRRARLEAEKLGQDIPVAPPLSPAWARFTGLLAALTGRLAPFALSDALQARVSAAIDAAPFRLILGLHRRSAIDLWPLAAREAHHAQDEITIEPLATEADWDKVIRGTCAAYGLTVEPGLLQRMKTEAAQLATARVTVAVPQNAEQPDTNVERSSVLPQVVTALQRMLQAWRDAMSARDPKDLRPEDMILTAEHYGHLADIKGAINALGEEAWAEWTVKRAAASKVNLEGYFSQQRFKAEVAQSFSGLMARLVDAGAGDRQDLSMLPRGGGVAAEHDSLIQALSAPRRLLTNADQTYLRLSHRSILDHWTRARAWLASSQDRFRVKAQARALISVRDVVGPETWPDDTLEDLAGLLLDWVGSGDGEDAELRDALRKALTTRLDVTQVAYPGTTRMQRLPIDALAQGERALFERLFNKCLASDHLPKFAGVFCIISAEVGEVTALTQLLHALGPEQAATEVNWVDEKSGTFPLLQAAQNGHADVVTALIDAGAEVNLVDLIDGVFPLLQAAQQGHTDVVTALIDAGAEVNLVNVSNGTFPLLIVAETGHTDVVMALIDAGAEVNLVKVSNGTFPLLMAAQEGHTDIVTALLKAGAEVNRVNPINGTFPLLLAAQNGHTDVVTALIDAGAEVKQVDPINNTFPLLMAAQNGQTDSAIFLINAGAAVNQIDPIGGGFPLMQAAQHGHAEIVMILLNAGAAVNQVNNATGAFPLLRAARNGHTDVVTALIDAGAEVNRVYQINGTCPLLHAAQQGHTDVVTALLKAGAEVNRVIQTSGIFPLLMAAQNGHTDVVTALIDAGAEVNQVQEKTGGFPLLQAAQYGHTDVVTALLKAGAEVNRVSSINGLFPLLQAAQQGHTDVVTALLIARAEVNLVDPIDGSFPLLVAAQYGHTDVVIALIDAGADIEQRHEKTDGSALVYAAANGQRAIVELLLAQGASRSDLPDGIDDAIDALLAGTASDPEVTPERPASDGETLPPPPIPGHWETEETNEAFIRRFEGAFRSAGFDPRRFRGFLAARKLVRFAGLSVTLYATTMGLKNGDDILAVELFWIDPEGMNPAPLGPGCDLSGMLTDILPADSLKTLNAEPLAALAQLAIVTGTRPGFVIQDEDAFATKNAEALKIGGHPEAAWRGHRVSRGPNRIDVELSAVHGKTLNRLRVTFGIAPFRLEPPAVIRTIAEAVFHDIKPFVETEGGYLPIRIFGILSQEN